MGHGGRAGRGSGSGYLPRHWVSAQCRLKTSETERGTATSGRLRESRVVTVVVVVDWVVDTTNLIDEVSDDCTDRYMWLGSVAVRALDLQSTGRVFNSRPPHCRVATLDKSFTLAQRL